MSVNSAKTNVLVHFGIFSIVYKKLRTGRNSTEEKAMCYATVERKKAGSLDLRKSLLQLVGNVYVVQHLQCFINTKYKLDDSFKAPSKLFVCGFFIEKIHRWSIPIKNHNSLLI